MTTYGNQNQHINLHYGDDAENADDKVRDYNKEVGTSARLPTEEPTNFMSDMFVKVEEKIKMCRYTRDYEGAVLEFPYYKLYKYYGNGNHVLLKPYENSRGKAYVMIKGQRHYLDELKGDTKDLAHHKKFVWDYHYHYGNTLPAIEELQQKYPDKTDDTIPISKGVLEALISANQQIYNKNIELSIALMKTTAVLEDFLKM